MTQGVNYNATPETVTISRATGNFLQIADSFDLSNSLTTDVTVSFDFSFGASMFGSDFQLPKDAQKTDGVSSWANLRGKESKPAREELLFWHGKGEATAIRQGDWKLHFNYGRQKPEDPVLDDGPALYNLRIDPLEKNDLSSKYPEKVNELSARAKVLLRDVYRDQVPLGSQPGAEELKPPLQAYDVWGEYL